MVLSPAPISQQFYGVAGRSLGFLHYIFLAFILLGAAFESRALALSNFLKGLILVGLFEALYGLLQFFDSDPINWENKQNWVFGTFGNPNFLSAFMGISVSASLFLFFQDLGLRWTWLTSANVVLGTTTAVLSGSVQGLVLISVSAALLAITLAFLKSKVLGVIFSTAGMFTFTTTVFGILNIGPLARFVFQESTTFRGDYWRTGITMFRENLLTGVGLDSYGDYYRQYRDFTAGQRRGLDTYSDSAHNLLIDLASTGGVLLLASYIFVNLIVVSAVYRTLKNTERFEIAGLALPIVWLTFQIQTFISINVSSLAIWGWIAAGLLIADSNKNLVTAQPILGQRGRTVQGQTRKDITVVATVLACIAFLLPLLVRDIQLRSALSSKSPTLLRDVATSWPRSCFLMAKAGEAYNDAGGFDFSLEIAVKSVESNPRCFDSWRHISVNPNATADQKNQALAKMRSLDPLLN